MIVITVVFPPVEDQKDPNEYSCIVTVVIKYILCIDYCIVTVVIKYMLYEIEVIKALGGANESIHDVMMTCIRLSIRRNGTIFCRVVVN